MNKKLKRIISVLLVMAIVLASFTFTSSAAASETDIVDGIAFRSAEFELIADEIEEVITDDDLSISKEIAYYIAGFFIEDMIVAGGTCWDTDTAILDMTTLYDETGEGITAYSFELTDGYIVVSAYIDTPNIVMEWADEATPIYEEFDIEKDSKITYIGAIDYYIDNGGGNLETIDGIKVPREELTNDFEEMRNIDNAEEAALIDIIQEKQTEENLPSGITTFADNNTSGGYISNPFTYAKNVYGGTWTATSEWANNWENYAHFVTFTNFPNNARCCGLLAITNLIKMYGNKYNNSSIKSSSNSSVFSEVLTANEMVYPRCYTPDGGSSISGANVFIKNSFDRFNVSVSVKGTYGCSYSNLKTSTSAVNRLTYITTQGHSVYGNHAMVGYAYNRMVNTGGTYLSFLKVCDGKNFLARYVTISSLSNDVYWEINF